MNFINISALVVLPVPLVKTITTYFFDSPLDWLHLFLLQAFFSLLALFLVQRSASLTTSQPHIQKVDEIFDVKKEEAAQVPVAVTHRFSNDCHFMVQSFLKLLDPEAVAWVNMVDKPGIQVYKHPITPNCFKVICTLNNSAETSFDLISDITRRMEYDDLIAEVKILEEIDAQTRIQYVRMKPVMITASRDVVLLSHNAKVGDRQYVSVTKSMDDDRIPERKSEGIVRMTAGIAGQMVTVDPNYPTKSRLLQIADGDPKGWIPKAVINFVATVAVPQGIQKLNTKVEALPTLDKCRLDRGGIVEVTPVEDKVVKVEKKEIEMPLVVKNSSSMQLAAPTHVRMLNWFRRHLKWAEPFMVSWVLMIVVYGVMRGRRFR